MADKTWMTQESYDRLKEELRHLEEVERPAIARRIDEARQEGDLRKRWLPCCSGTAVLERNSDSAAKRNHGKCGSGRASGR